MNNFPLVCRRLRSILASAVFAYATGSFAQILERDAITVPVGVSAKFVAGSGGGGINVSCAGENYVSLVGGTSQAGTYESTPVTVSLKPGKDYIFSVLERTGNLELFTGITFQLDAPPGNKVYVEDLPSSRVTLAWYTNIFKVRIEPEATASLGEPSSLRPGRIVWTLGLGTLSNGKTAGLVSLRSSDLAAETFSPNALEYDNISPDVERISVDDVLRQIYVASSLIDIIAVNNYSFRIKVYPRNSGQIGAKVDGLYVLSGDPLYEYLVENPVYPTFNSKLRITRIVRQGSASLEAWTEMTRIVGGFAPNTYTTGYAVVEWVEKPAGATIVTGPVKRQMSYSSGGEEIVTSNGLEWPYKVVAAEEIRNYTNFSWGSELTKITFGTNPFLNPEVKTFSYTDKRLTQSGGTGSGLTYIEYYNDFDRRGQIYRSFKPFGDTAASVSNPAIGEVTTYDYEADWTGRKVLPKSIITTINSVVTAKSESSYGYEWYNDQSSAAASNLILVVTTRKDYYDGSHFLPTVSKVFRDDSDPNNSYFPGLPHSLKRPDGTMSVTAYFRGTFSTINRNFTATKGGPDILKVTFNGTSVASTETATMPSYQLGDQSQVTEGDFRIVPNVSAAEAVVRSADGLVVSTQKWICTGTTSAFSWQVVQRDVHHYSVGYFLERTSRDAGNTGVTWDVVTNQWTKGRLDYTIDESGIRTDFTYDTSGRVLTKVQQGGAGLGTSVATLTTTLGYDSAGRVVSEAISGNTTTRNYDMGGRLTDETKPGQGQTTFSYQYSNEWDGFGWRATTTSHQSTGYRTEESWGDGRRKAVSGTGVVAENYTYLVESDGRMRASITTGNRTRSVWTDLLGRTTKTSRPGFTGQVASEESSVYDDYSTGGTGRLIKSTKTGFAATIFVYNAASQRVRSGLDVDGSSSLVLGSVDRVTDTSEMFEYMEGAWWLKQSSSNYPYTGGSAATPQEQGKTRTRLTGLTGTLRSEVRTYDAEGNETRTTRVVDRTNKVVTETTRRPGMAADAVAKSLNGLLIESTGHDGITVKKRYDGALRLSAVIDPRTGTETYPSLRMWYHDGTYLVSSHRDRDYRMIADFAYDGAGRLVWSQDALGNTTRTSYTPRGEIDKVWGSARYPVSYSYNSYGERVAMKTYRDSANASAADTTSFPSLGSFDETVWEFDEPSGLLKKKIDAKGRFVEYTYNLRGQTNQRFWSRTLPNTSTRVSATYSYDSATGENTGITYNDGTPSVTYTFTRSGQVDSVADTSGTRDFIYDGTKPWQLTSEALGAFYGSRVLTHTYEATLSTNTGDSSYTPHTLGSVPGRAKGLQLGTVGASSGDLEFIYASSDAGRVAGVVSKRDNGSASRQFVYGYQATSALLKTLSIVGNPFSVTREFEPYRDLVTKVETKWSTASRTDFVYAYDYRGLRQSVVQSGDVFADYGNAIHQIFTYNGRGELTAAGTFLGATATDQTMPLSARKHEFEYDGLGNRRWSNTSGATALKDNYTTNELNQYIQRENNTLAVGGVADADAKVAVRETDLAGRAGAGKHWGDNVTVENQHAPFYANLKIYAVKPGSGGAPYSRQVMERLAFLPPATQKMKYDDDGNILTDGVWNYEWDAENRLWAMQTTDIAMMGGVPPQRLEFKYDFMNRRVEKLVRGGWNGSVFTAVASQRRYIYDGWSMIAELSVSGSILNLARSYTWGLDIARSLTDAGGVGALLQIHDYTGSGKDYFPAYDGNGNIAALFDSSDGSVAAAYEYSPYGEFLRCEGLYAKENPLRFSTKFTDDESGLVYYGQRYYNPSQGRFLGRDPIEEHGGLNLYGFCGNDAINGWDILGCDGVTTTEHGAFLASVTDLLGNARDWTFSSRTDAENWYNAWGEGNAALLQPYLERYAVGEVAARAASIVSDPVTATIYLNSLGIGAMLRDMLGGYDDVSDNDRAGRAIGDYGASHVFTIAFGSAAPNIQASTLTLLVGADSSVEGGFNESDRQNIIRNAKQVQKFLDEADMWRIRVNLLISSTVIAAPVTYSSSSVTANPELGQLLNGASRVIPMLVTQDRLPTLNPLVVAGGMTNHEERGSLFLRRGLANPFAFAHELGHSGGYMNYKSPKGLERHAPSLQFNNIMHEQGVLSRFADPLMAFADGYWRDAINKAAYAIPRR